MTHIPSTTIFQKIPFPSTVVKKVTGNREISYRPGKLRVQRDQAVKDNERGAEKQSKINKGVRNGDEHFLNKYEKDLIQIGINTQMRNIATKTEADRQVVDDLVKKSNRNIISISSIFPWDLFPNSIDVEESRVTFRFSQFLSSQSHSVDIKDISNIFIESSIFFSTLQVVSRTYVKNEIKIGNLNKTKAQKVKRIIEGLRTFSEHNINTSNYEINELISKIEEFQTNQES